MTVESFTPQTEHRNINEVNHEDGPGSPRAAERIAADFLSQYERDPNMARQGWQGTPAGNFTDGVSAAINPDTRNVPGLELVGNIANEQAISPLLANNGALFDKLDTYQSDNKSGFHIGFDIGFGSNADETRSMHQADCDGNIGKGDMEAYLNDSKNDHNSPDYKFVQQLKDGLIVDSNGHSVLNGDGGIDRDQIGRLTGTDLTGQNLNASDLASKVTQNTQDELAQLSASIANPKDFSPGAACGQRGDLPYGNSGDIHYGSPYGNSGDIQYGSPYGNSGEIQYGSPQGNSGDIQYGSPYRNAADIPHYGNDIQPVNPSQGPKDTEPQCAEVPPPCKDGTVKPGDKEAMCDSVAQPGDGYIRVAARLLGNNNTDDPTVLEGSKELESLHPGDRHDGWLNLNEKVLTPDEISQARNNSDQYRVVNQILEKYEQKTAC